MNVLCEVCSSELDSRQHTIYQRAAGWVKVRDKGANELRLAVRELRFRCRACIELPDPVPAGGAWEQGALWT